MKREKIIDGVSKIVGVENITTKKEVLEESTHDRFRKFECYHGYFKNPLPAAVVFARNTEDISKVLSFANDNCINVVPRTGISATEGGLETVVENSIVLDGSRMNNIINIDIYNMQATCECGVPLEVLEDKLRDMGYTTGHSPQSKPLAQMGGLVATRSIGQFSTLYGGIEDMVVGLEFVFPDGHIARIKNVPRRAAGPDIRHVAIGNEGTLFYITEVTVKIFKYYPENNVFLGYVLDDMIEGIHVLRDVMAMGYKPSVARLYDSEDGAHNFSHFANDKCVLLFMAEGPKGISDATIKGIEEIVDEHKNCQKVDSKYISKWLDSLNWGPDELVKEKARVMQTKNVCYTTEISGSWSAVEDIYNAVMKRAKKEVPDITLFGAHSSHSYINGTNLYFVYYYNVVDCEPKDEINKYHMPIKKIIVEETLKAGGSMCHHHGVGKHRVHWIKEEHGTAYRVLHLLKSIYDPNGIMNKGTIYYES